MAIMVILITTALIALLDVPPLRKKRQKKELWSFLALLGFGTAISILHALHIQLPNPLDMLTFIYKPISQAVRQLLT